MGIANSAEWYTRWCEPIIWALYQNDPVEIRKAIDAAKSALTDGELNRKETSCLRYQLAYLEFQAQRFLVDDQWLDPKNTRPYLDILSTPSDDPSNEGFRVRLYIQFRLRLDLVNREVLDPVEFQELLAKLPAEEQTIELWRYIASWAFKRRETAILQQAYECAVMNAAGFQREWTWLRVDLMWKLSNGTATPEHITWVVKSAQIPNHLASLKGEILKRARALGLVDQAMEQYIEARALELAEAEEERVAKLLINHTRNEEILDQAKHRQYTST